MGAIARDTHAQAKTTGHRPRLVADARGAAMTEYVLLIGTVALATLAALLVVGPSLVRNFELTRNILVSPFP